MRRRLILTVLSLLTALTALGPLVPVSTHAAPAALSRPSSPTSITGTVVATPQSTPPTTLLVQVGGQTIAVLVSYSTLVTRSDNSAIALSQLRDGDTVQISGNSLANGSINALQVVDLSLPTVTPTPTPQPPLPLTVQGTLVSVLGGSILCLQNAIVTGNALQPQAQIAGPCSYGQQPVYVTGTTQYLLSDGSAASLGKLLGGDTLQVVGTLANGQFTASLIRDLSQSTPLPTQQPAVALTVTGSLVSMPNSSTLCLQNAVVTGNALQPQVQFVGSCSSGQQPVYVTGGTQYLLSDGGAAGLSSLRPGDTLQVVGTLANDQFTATLIRDLSQSTPPPPIALTLTGTLVSQQGGTLLCLLNTSVTGNALQPRAQVVGPCSSGQQPVYVNAATQYSLSDGTAAGLASLRPTDTLQVTGLIANGQFTATQVKDLSQATPPPPVALTVQGNLASVPTSTILCLQVTSVTSNALAPRALTASYCPGGQLPVYLNGNTQFRLNDGTLASLGSLRLGDALLVTGIVASNQFTASQVRDLLLFSQYIPRPPVTLTAQGILTAAPSRLTTPLLFCLRNAVVISNNYRQRIALTSICPAGQLPVTVTGGTTFVRRYNSPSALDELRAGDTLQVTGTVGNAQFIASRIKNLSIQASYTTVVGRIVAIAQTGTGINVTVRVQRDASGRENAGGGQYVTVFVQVNTQVVNVYGVSSRPWELSPGQSITMLGTPSNNGGGFIRCFRVRIR